MKTLEELQAVGAFIDRTPVERTIKFSIGENEYDATVKIRPFSLAEQERLWGRVGDDPDAPQNVAAMIATLVCFGERGEQTLTVEQAGALHPSLSTALIVAIREVNGQLVKN